MGNRIFNSLTNIHSTGKKIEISIKKPELGLQIGAGKKSSENNLVTSSNFLTCMNQFLSAYKDNLRVIFIAGYTILYL